MRTIIKMVLPISLLGLGSCGGSTVDDGQPIVVVSTSILADVTTRLVGDQARVEILIPPGVDPHDFALSSAQATMIGEADLVVVNGLGLDRGVEDVAVSAGVPLVTVAPQVDPLPWSDHDGDHPPEDDTGLDPHFWQDPRRMMMAVDVISQGLVSHIPGVDPGEAAERYRATLETLDAEVAARWATVPAERRVMVTNHDSFGYYADRYGLEVIGVVIPGGTTLAQPGSAELAVLVAKLEAHRVRAIFVDNVASREVAEAVASELGEEVAVVTLVSDSLGVDGGPDDYVEMIRFNTDAMIEVLK